MAQPFLAIAMGALISITSLSACSVEIKLDSPLVFSGESVELQLEQVGNHMLVAAVIEGIGNKNFIVDTGSAPNVIDSAIVAQMGLQVIGEREVLSGGTIPVNAEIVIIPKITVGKMRIENAEFLSIDLDGMSGGMLQGVLGMELFSKLLLTIDPSHKRITVSKSELVREDPNVIPFESSENHIQIDANVAGQMVGMTIDLGAPGAFTLPDRLLSSMPIDGDWQQAGSARLVDGERTQRNATLNGDIKFAGFTYSKPAISVLTPSPDSGNIGTAILQDLVLKIDQKNGLLEFQKAGSSKVAVNNKSSQPRRLGVQFRGFPGGSVLIVGRVDNGSLGEQAGIKAGDVILTLNDRPTEEYGMRELGKTIRSSQALHFEIERDAEHLDITIQ